MFAGILVIVETSKKFIAIFTKRKLLSWVYSYYFFYRNTIETDALNDFGIALRALNFHEEITTAIKLAVFFFSLLNFIAPNSLIDSF